MGGREGQRISRMTAVDPRAAEAAKRLRPQTHGGVPNRSTDQENGSILLSYGAGNSRRQGGTTLSRSD